MKALHSSINYKHIFLLLWPSTKRNRHRRHMVYISLLWNICRGSSTMMINKQTYNYVIVLVDLFRPEGSLREGETS